MEIKFILMITLIVLLVLLFSVTLIVLLMWQMHMMMMGGYSFPMFWFLVFISIPLVIVLIMYLFLSSKKNEGKKYESIKHYVYPLTDEEKNIVEFLKQNNYRSTQKEIQQHFKLSKVKAHRILARLESRGIIIRTKRGREMLVVLKKEEVS
jgi:Uncharacterized membrane-associated protein/domain